jgi:archaellum component FlaC
MKRNIPAIIWLIAFWSHTLYAQNSSTGKGKSYVGDINKMFAAAPTANNLMKFEEVPVSYYTGIPDISIPIASMTTRGSETEINVKLKYHPLNAKPEDKSGETGLGWSLIAGGTISRTIRGGAADEKTITIAFSTPTRVKFGIYDEVNNPTGKLMRDEPYDQNEYKFASGLGKYDTEYDLYQYNFAGHSGRFYIAKDGAGNFKVEKLDRNNLQIICVPDNQGIIDSFTIVDDKGLRYTFNPMEKSHKSITTIKTGLVNLQSNVDSNYEMDNYWASFHLTKIVDQNNITLAIFNYDLSSMVKFEETPTITRRLAKDVYYYNTADNPNGGFDNPDDSMPGALESQTVNNETLTKLLTSIEVIGKGTIYFNYEIGRLDTNYKVPSELYKVKSIQVNPIGQNMSQYTDKFIFEYEYTDTTYQYNETQQRTDKKMLLSKVKKIIPNTQNWEYSMEYTAASGELLKDKWEYFKGEGSGIKTDVLKAMTYPTKGKVVFDFGANDYSHYFNGAAMEEVTGHTETHTLSASIDFGQFSTTYKQPFFNVNTAQNVKLHLILGNLIYYNWIFKIYKKNVDNTFVKVYEAGNGSQACNRPPPTCATGGVDEGGEIHSEYNYEVYFEPGNYYASLEGNYSASVPGNTADAFEATTVEDVFINEQVRNGGGIRINSISYLANASSQTSAKKYVYNYKDIANTAKSSGSLVFPEPVKKYQYSYSYNNKHVYPTLIYTANLDVTTNYNILPVQKTQGSDVGYKYVTIEQIDANGIKNGKTVYTYRSPLDYPNTSTMTLQMPVLPIPDQDYLRGQIISEKSYNEQEQLLSEINTDYNTLEFTKNDGVKLIDNYFSSMISLFFTFINYQFALDQTGISVALTTPFKNIEKFGLTLPTQKIEKSYFHKNGIQNILSTTTDYLYNGDDYLSSVSQNYAEGSVDTSSYKYAKEKNNQLMIAKNMIGIPLETTTTQTKDGVTKTLGRSETIYPTSLPTAQAGNLILPLSSVSYDVLNNSPSTEVSYDKYDDKGNLLQYTGKDGIPVAIIWGYNKTQPIAKVEGMAYDQLMSAVSVSGIVTASDNDAADPSKEGLLLDALNSFRKEQALSGKLISTYTYDPLIGVTTITPPSGVRQIYTYDSANRLKEGKVRGKNSSGNYTDKKVSENNYNYKP